MSRLSTLIVALTLLASASGLTCNAYGKITHLGCEQTTACNEGSDTEPAGCSDDCRDQNLPGSVVTCSEEACAEGEEDNCGFVATGCYDVTWTYTLIAEAGRTMRTTKGGCSDGTSCADAKTSIENEVAEGGELHSIGLTVGSWGCRLTQGDASNAANFAAFEASPVAAAATAAAAEEAAADAPTDDGYDTNNDGCPGSEVSSNCHTYSHTAQSFSPLFRFFFLSIYFFSLPLFLSILFHLF
jgi:hypothetical protein